MSANLDESHEIALMEVGEDAPLQQQGQVGVNHMAWRMGNLDDLKELIYYNYAEKIYSKYQRKVYVCKT